MGFPVRLTLPPMRPVHHEHHGTIACHNAHSRPTLRAGVYRLSLATPLAVQAGTEGHTRLSWRLSPHLRVL
jgi:hypothetical protein